MKTIKATSCEDWRTEERKISAHSTTDSVLHCKAFFNSAFKTDTEHGPKSDGVWIYIPSWVWGIFQEYPSYLRPCAVILTFQGSASNAQMLNMHSGSTSYRAGN